MKKQILLICAVMLIQISAKAQYCSNDDRFTQTAIFTDAQIDYDTAVVYGNALNYQGVNQNLLLNICYPSAAVDTFTKRPLVILMHGGGFLVGGRNDMNSMCIEFSKRGFVAATIGYRLGWDTGVGGCDGDTISNEEAVYRGFQDAHAALRYLVANADTYKIDTSWIFCGGESAGGVNTLNIAFTSQDEMSGRYPFLQATLGDINNSGNSLQNTFSLKAVFNNWGSIVDTAFITADDALPMIAFHGDLDQCLPIDYGTYNGCPNYVHLFGSRPVYNKLLSLGVCAELTVKTGGDHGIYDETHAQDVFRVSRASCFFKSLFCDDCSTAYLLDSTATNCTALGAINTAQYAGFSMYPNPSNGIFTVNFNNSHNNKIRIDIYNMLGEIVFSDSNIEPQPSFEIDLSSIPKGLYFINLNDGQKNYAEKMMIR